MNRRAFFAKAGATAAAFLTAPALAQPADIRAAIAKAVRDALPPSPGLRPKIDVNAEMMQIKKLLSSVVKSLGIELPRDILVFPAPSKGPQS